MTVDHIGPRDQSGHAGRTAAAHAYRLLRTILGTATDDGLIASNPCQIKRAGTVHHPERPILGPAEVDALAAAFPPAMRAAVLLAALSGLRFGELFALARRHVDLTAGTVSVERALILRAGHAPTFGPTKTPRSRRVVHVPGFVMDILRDHMTDHVGPFGESLLFTMPGTSDTVGSWYVSRLMRTGREAIGRPDIRWHDLRHVSAVMAYKIGASTREVMDRLGHSTARAAQIYAHAADDADLLIAERLDTAYRARTAAMPSVAPLRGHMPAGTTAT